MRRKILTALLAISCTVTTQAQEFKIDLSGYDLDPRSMAFLDNGTGGQDLVIGSIAYNTTTPKFMLTKLDNTGAHVNSILRDDPGIERIVETFDNFVVTATEYIDRVMIRKYDSNLGLVLATEVPKVNPLSYGYSALYGAIDIEAVTFPGASQPNQEEKYYIFYTEGHNPTLNPSALLDVNSVSHNTALGVICVDRDLNLEWQRAYAEDARLVQDFAYSMIQLPDPNNQGDRLLALAGTRFDYEEEGIETCPDLYIFPPDTTGLFVMIINLTGDIVTNYKELVVTRDDRQPDILFDGTDLALSYQAENTLSLTAGATLFGIMKLDVGLTTFNTRLFWDFNGGIAAAENYGKSLSLFNSPSVTAGYVLGGWTVRGNKVPILLKVDNSLNLLDYTTYSDAVLPSAMTTTTFHRANGNYRHYLLSQHTPMFGNAEVILNKTTPLLNNCISEDFEVEYADPDVFMLVHNYMWDARQTSQQATVNEIGVTPNVINRCGAGKAAGISGVAHKMLNAEISPTIITNKSAGVVLCTVNSPKAAEIKILVSNMLGQVVYSGTHPVQQGENAIHISTASFTDGMNIIKLSAGTEFVKTSKVNVLN